jgi:hypothetical protein
MLDAVDEISLIGTILPESARPERRARICLHVVLERARTVAQLLADLDALAIWLCAHDDAETGSAVLALGDSIRDEVAS